MGKTTSELATAVLQKLTVLNATETASTEDAALITEVYTDKYAEWQDQELTYWVPDDIPFPLFRIIVDLIANEVRDEFGQQQTPEEKQSREQTLLRPLRRHMTKQTSGLPVRAKYF
jgi:hypothetical protein